MKYKSQLLTIENENIWDRYVEASNASIYHYSKWKHLIKSVFGHDSYYLYVENDEGNVCGVLPLVHMQSFLFGSFLVSMPYFNYGGVIADNEEVEQELISKARKLCAELKCTHVELRHDKDISSKLPCREDKVTMLLKLPETAEELSKAIGSKRRSQIKRPIREGAEFKIGGEELLNDFYKVFSVNMRDLGTPVYSKKFFKSILMEFGENCKISVVTINGEPVSAGFLILHNKIMEIPWASTLRKVNKFGVNMFLYWNILKSAIEMNVDVFDFGRSSKDAGTLKFKKQWGGESKQLYWHYLLTDGEEMPVLNHSNKKYEMMISAWQKLPVVVSNTLGPHIIKGIP